MLLYSLLEKLSSTLITRNSIIINFRCSNLNRAFLVLPRSVGFQLFLFFPREALFLESGVYHQICSFLLWWSPTLIRFLWSWRLVFQSLVLHGSGHWLPRFADFLVLHQFFREEGPVTERTRDQIWFAVSCINLGIYICVLPAWWLFYLFLTICWWIWIKICRWFSGVWFLVCFCLP